MKKQLVLLLLGVVGATALAWAQRSDVSWVTFESARKIESVDGDLDRASELYGLMIGSSDRELAERARRQLAGISRKLGQPDTEAGALAQSRAAAASPTLKRVCSVDCGWGESVVSPSGRRIVWRYPFDAVLILQEISNAKRRHLTSDADGGVDILWAPDDARIAYRTQGALSASQVRILDVGNGRFRDITGGKPLAWSADGRKLLIVRAGSGTTSPEFIWVSTGREATEEKLPSALRDFVVSPSTGVRGRGFSSPLHEGVVKVSPDGKFMAYNAGPSSGDVKTYVARLDGSGSLVASDSLDVELPIGWTPDSRHLLYRRQSSAGELSLWAIRVVDGKPQGAPIAIRRDLGRTATTSVLGLTRSGTLFFRRRSDEADTYGTSLDPASGRITAQPRPLPIQTVAGRNRVVRFSPDSRQLAYVFVSGSSNAPLALRLFSFDTKLERPAAPEYGVTGDVPCWTADGSSLVFYGIQKGTASGKVKLDLSSGSITSVPRDLMDRCSYETFVTGTGIGVRRAGESIFKEIHTFDVEFQPTRPASFSHDVTISRTGRLAAFKEKLGDSTIALRVVPIDGGRPVELARGTDLDVNGIAWSGDDRFVFFCRRAADGTIETFRVPASGGTALSTGYKGPGAGDIDVSPDGTRLISAWGLEGEFEIWSMESFLPSTR